MMNIRGEGWQSDCPKCVVSKFTCDQHYITNPITEERLREIEALREKATPGPWEHPYGSRIKGDDQFIAACDVLRRYEAQDGFDEAKNNAALIAALHNAFPDLAAALREAWAERDRLRVALRKSCKPEWFYLGDECNSDQCRFSIDECIDDFGELSGDHVLLISGARQVPDMWVALHHYTEAEKIERDSDDEYTFTVHATEEAALAALNPKGDGE